MAGFRDAMARRLERGRVDTGVLRDVMAKYAYEKCHLRGSGRGRPLLYAEAFGEVPWISHFELWRMGGCLFRGSGRGHPLLPAMAGCDMAFTMFSVWGGWFSPRLRTKPPIVIRIVCL